MSEGLDREAFLGGYLAEVEEHLASSGRNLLAVEAALARGDPHPRAVRELYRSLHTIKGLSGMVGVEPAVDVAHAMEELLRAAERAGGSLSAGAIDALAKGLRALEVRVAALAARQPVPPAPRALLDDLEAQLAGGSAASSPRPARKTDLPPAIAAKLTPVEHQQIAAGVAAGKSLVHLEFVPSPERAAAGLNITAVRERVSAAGELVRVIPTSVPRSDRAPAGLSFTLLVLTDGDPAEVARAAGLDPPEPAAAASPSPAPVPQEEEPLPESRASVVRVEVARLDSALHRLGDLVVTRMRLGRAVAALGDQGAATRALKEILDELGGQLRDLRGAITQARMVSVAELLDRVPLLVRGLSRATGKAVELTIDAGRAELDKSVAERVFPAIVHLVRNAVDHAIERPDERRAAGKPETGRIAVRCHELGDGRLELTVEDDGRGVSREAVARRAGRPVPQNDDELLDLLATPGLSTAEQTTTTSGRGLGVDIVRRVADELGGELRLSTRPGAGTTFTLRVPLSITIVDAFSFLTSGQSYVVPVSGVEEIIDVEPARLVRPPRPRGAAVEVSVIERRGEAVPLVRLDELLGLQRAAPPAAPKAIVVRRASAAMAFVVDRMLGLQEVVVRPVDDPLVKAVGVAGATDLGDGKPTLVLDLGALGTRLQHAGRPS